MTKCPNCDLSLTSAPWRFDDNEHGIHWVCPTDARVQEEYIYAPVSLAEAISDALRTRTTSQQIG
jgi:hypothetical protein